METFNFPYHTLRMEYMTATFPILFGDNWQFLVSPEAEEERLFTLVFHGLRYNDSNPLNDLTRLEEFYKRHQRDVPFIYPHPVHGPLTVKFYQPLVIPPIVGNSVVQGMEVTLVEKLS